MRSITQQSLTHVDVHVDRRVDRPVGRVEQKDSRPGDAHGGRRRGVGQIHIATDGTLEGPLLRSGCAVIEHVCFYLDVDDAHSLDVDGVGRRQVHREPPRAQRRLAVKHEVGHRLNVGGMSNNTL